MENQPAQSFSTIDHQEIDSQHTELDRLIRQLDTICATGGNCGECPSEHHDACADKVAALADELLIFLSKHFSYEDKLMRQLPRTPECSKHMGDHKWAHSEISSEMTEVIDNLDYRNPKLCAKQIQDAINTSMETHISSIDIHLADHLAGSA